MHSTPEIIKQLKQDEQNGLLQIKKPYPQKQHTTNCQNIHDVLELLADPVIIVNTTGTLLWTNTAIETITQYTKENLIGKNFFQLDFINNKSKALMVKNLTQRMLGINIPPYIIEISTKEDQKLYFEINANIITYDNQKADLVVLRNVSERSKAQAALTESEATLRTITQSAKDAIIMIDNQGNISFWNHAAYIIFGYTETEALGKNLHTLLAPPHYHEAYQKGFNNFLKTGQGNAIGQTLELTALTKNQQEIPIELSLSSVKLKNQWHAVGIIRNIKERKQTEEELRIRATQLERFSKVAVTRELRMRELKKQVKDLKQQLKNKDKDQP